MSNNKIDATNMDIDEYCDLLYDLRDGIVKYDDVIWPPVKDYKNYLQRGDIVKVENNYFVVVSVNNDDGIFFAATLDAFVHTENSQIYNYLPTNSGWEYINDKVKKVGHITLD